MLLLILALVRDQDSPKISPLLVKEDCHSLFRASLPMAGNRSFLPISNPIVSVSCDIPACLDPFHFFNLRLWTTGMVSIEVLRVPHRGLSWWGWSRLQAPGRVGLQVSGLRASLGRSKVLSLRETRQQYRCPATPRLGPPPFSFAFSESTRHHGFRVPQARLAPQYASFSALSFLSFS